MSQLAGGFLSIMAHYAREFLRIMTQRFSRG
jgi:hypothetical protein